VQAGDEALLYAARAATLSRMAETTTLTGPDLRAGIASGDLAEGAMLTGHADGEAVLLARVGGTLLAVAGTCTHYGGPLGEGLLVGETVRCPWHHACFSLRTGEALKAPALNDLGRWNVQERGGRIVVTGKASGGGDMVAAIAAGRRISAPPSSVVIVGGGAAGNAAAEMLRRKGYAGPLTMIDPDEGSPYDRPNLSKDYLAGTAPEEWIPLHPAEFYEEHRIERLRARVEAIDASARVVKLDDGSKRQYGVLLLCPGAEPVRLEIPVSDGGKLLYLRSLADSRRIIESAQRARRAVVLGASFIGLEVAASLRNRGLEVTVVAPEERPLERVMGPELGAFIRRLHEQHGVVFHLGHTALSIGGSFVTLDDGRLLDADIVVAGVGVRPRIELARAAGIRIDNGIVVNEFLETSVPGIFAAGDVARWPDAYAEEPVRVEHWVVAERMGQAAARNMLGAQEPFRDVPFFWSQHYDVVIAYVGHAASWDRIELDGDPDAKDCAATFWRDGVPLAVATIFRDLDSLTSELGMERATRVASR
jgi:NADPH-dependent 2,4-dienoyl-CoA reductase/sulfur reductase-like enzyme/nitrite reductase/ring-hydroxylating ferredoxin subunit